MKWADIAGQCDMGGGGVQLVPVFKRGPQSPMI
jgi:hypothetical protein